MSMKGQPIVIVKKRQHHAGHHGGAWKVAYADFVTAMMAFFLVMWLVNQSKPVKAAIGGYFRDPGVFETSTGGNGVLPGGTAASQETSKASESESEQKTLERAVTRIRERLEQVPEFKTLSKQIEFTVTPDGLRIDLLEADKSSFFDSGSAVMRAETERILVVIARELGALSETVIIEGHTDSRPYATSDRYSNWELSADRANAARRVMERGGLKPSQVSGVRGLADRELKVPDEPLNSRNRRVSILVARRALRTS
jgi:chemotaxis protein MotB